MQRVAGAMLALCAACACAGAGDGNGDGAAAESGGAPAGDAREPARLHPGETRLANLRQLTFGGQNAEAYFSADGARLVFQSMSGDMQCDQMYVMDADGGHRARVSTGGGVTTCGYFLDGDRRVLFASTHLAGDACPPRPDHSMGYVWPVYDAYDIFVRELGGGDLARLTDSKGYDAEATVSPDGTRIVFTSSRDGDLELYAMDVDGSNVRRLTREPGYDGGAFFSPDGAKIVYRAHHPATDEERAADRALLEQGLVRPSRMELFVMNADGSDKRQITKNGSANFCPYFTPDGKRIIFASNLDPQDPAKSRGREFDLFLIDVDGANLEQVTFTPEFDGFPMFSPDGKRLVFASNRNGLERGETNIFIADWVE